MSTMETWRKSSRSNSESMCVELAIGTAHADVRDTKNRDGGTLTLAPDSFHAFLASVKDGRP